VTKTPSKLPKEALSSAQASSPPDDLVSTITIFTVIGKDAAMTIPVVKSSDNTLKCNKNFVRPQTAHGTNPILKTCTNKLNHTYESAFAISFVFKLNPDIINMNITAIHDAVTFGAKYSPANGGRILAKRIAVTALIKNECFK